jgi:hypothetical protein
VVASNVGAESSFDISPANTKEGCCPELLDVPVPLTLLEDARRSVQGTAICLPPVEEVPGDALVVLDDPPGLVAPPAEPLLLPELLVPLLEL